MPELLSEGHDALKAHPIHQQPSSFQSVFTGQASVSNHLLERYRLTIASLIKQLYLSQSATAGNTATNFSSGKGGGSRDSRNNELGIKGSNLAGTVVGDIAGRVAAVNDSAAALAAAVDLNAALLCRGLDPCSLADASTRPLTMEQVHSRQRWAAIRGGWCVGGYADTVEPNEPAAATAAAAAEEGSSEQQQQQRPHTAVEAGAVALAQQAAKERSRGLRGKLWRLASLVRLRC